jgi:hypothetical protein
MKHSRGALERKAERRHLLALLRSRRAVHRILVCVADLAEGDEGCARALAQQPEVLAALIRLTKGGVPWAAPRRTVRIRNAGGVRRPAGPLVTGGVWGTKQPSARHAMVRPATNAMTRRE